MLSLKQAVLSELLSLRNIFLRKREGFFSKGGEVQAHYAPHNYHPDAHVRSGGCLDRSCRLRGSYELDSYRRLGLWFERHIEELGKECPTLGGWRCSIHENPRRLILGNPLPFEDPLGKWVQTL